MKKYAMLVALMGAAGCATTLASRSPSGSSAMDTSSDGMGLVAASQRNLGCFRTADEAEICPVTGSALPWPEVASTGKSQSAGIAGATHGAPDTRAPECFSGTRDIQCTPTTLVEDSSDF